MALWDDRTFIGTDHYSLLGVPRTATFSEIKRAYYRRAKQCHPDRFGGDPQKEEEFKRLVEAFNVLSDPLRRKAYDAYLADASGDLGRPPDGTGWFPEEDAAAILDTAADDILEELIVGNTIPQNTSLRTLLLDMERTEKFCRFREAKTCYHHRRFLRAYHLLVHCVAESPGNILYRYYLAHVLRRFGKFREAIEQLEIAIQIGACRRPPQRLNRIRRELAAWRGQTPLGRFARTTPALEIPDGPDERMRRQLSRWLTRLWREEHRRLPDA